MLGIYFYLPPEIEHFHSVHYNSYRCYQVFLNNSGLGSRAIIPLLVSNKKNNIQHVVQDGVSHYEDTADSVTGNVYATEDCISINVQTELGEQPGR